VRQMQDGKADYDQLMVQYTTREQQMHVCLLEITLALLYFTDDPEILVTRKYRFLKDSFFLVSHNHNIGESL